jgi:hypothetical protein
MRKQKDGSRLIGIMLIIMMMLFEGIKHKKRRERLSFQVTDIKGERDSFS